MRSQPSFDAPRLTGSGGAWRPSMIMVLGATLIAAACAAGPGPSGPAGTAAPTHNAAPTTGSPAASIDPADCPNFVEVVETGPLPPDMPEFGPIPRAQERLRGDLAAARTYAEGHPDEFASIRWENVPRVRVVIGFTDRIEVHCAALRAILEFPDEFEIIRQPRTATSLEDIQRRIVELAGPKLRYAGQGAGDIHAGFRADGEDVAREVWAMFGDVVELTVGFLPYPPGAQPARDCAMQLGPIVADSPFAATLRLEGATVRSGLDFKATAIVTNTADGAIEFESGEPMIAYVYRAGTDEIVASYDGGIGGVGAGRTLAPGQSIELEVLGGTASCSLELGYALPPGVYEVRAAIDQYERPPAGATIVRHLLTAPVLLSVVP